MKILWSDMKWPEVEKMAKKEAMVILPIGSTEQHGPHLPLNTDTTSAFEIAKRAAEKVSNKFPTLVLPPIWTGYSPHHMDFPGTITLSSKTFINLVFEICKSVIKHGFKRIILLNGHMGNAPSLKVSSCQLAEELKISVAVINYFDLLSEHICKVRDSQSGGISHAGELETSLQMAVHPELVDVKRFKKVYRVPKTKFLSGDIFLPNKIFVYRNFKNRTEMGPIGDSTLASEKKGNTLLNIASDELGSFLTEFKKWNPFCLGDL